MTKSGHTVVRFADLNGPEDMLKKLRWDGEQVEQDEASSYPLFNFTVTAWHLYVDWIPKSGTEGAKLRRRGLSEEHREIMQIAGDLANGNKHFVLDRDDSIRHCVVRQVTKPDIRDYHAYFYGPKIYILTDRFIFNPVEWRNQVLSILEWIITEKSERSPEELKKALDYSRLKANP